GDKRIAFEAVAVAGARTDEVVLQNFTGGRNPANAAGRIAGHQCKSAHIPRHHGARSNHRIIGDRIPAHDRRVGADCDTASDTRRLERILARHMRTRIAHIGKYRIRSYENIVGNFETIVETDIVLDGDPVAHPDATFDEYIMRELAIAADMRTFQHDTVLPESRAGADRSVRRNF